MVAVTGMMTPALISVPGLPMSNLAITSVGFSMDANVQFMHALSSSIYVYSFGERMGVVEINGVVFYRMCGSTSSSSGILGLLNFYAYNSAGYRSYPLSVTVGGAALKGYLTGIRSTFSDSERGMTGFMLRLSTTPMLYSRVVYDSGRARKLR